MPADGAALKEEGNALFREQKYKEASFKYSQAIQATNDNAALAVLYSNRAQCYLSLARWQDAKFDAAEALLADPNHHKSWHRLGRAYVGANLFVQAVQVFEFAARVTQDSGLAAMLWQSARDAKKQVKTARASDVDEHQPSLASAEQLARAAKLKEEGNALINAQTPDHKAAYAKFTLALVFDPFSAILHCNRAYCANTLKEWDAAETDARAAISLDDAYVKAWARLGAAKLGQRKLAEGEDAFKRGLQILKAKGDLSPADSRLKASIEQSLQEARNETRVVKGSQIDQSQLPWALANQIIKPNFDPSNRATWYSSAWVILAAHNEFVEGSQLLYATQRVGSLSMGSTGAMELLTNGLITDSRSFFADRPDFFQKYQQQVMHEVTSCKGFHEKNAYALMEAVKARLRSEGGWGSHNTLAPVRKSVAVTIRAWFLNAFLRERLVQGYDEALELYKHIVDFLELGREEWATTPKEERGVVFELTFLLGIKKCYAECIRSRFFANIRMGIPDTAGLLERIRVNAESMLQQTATFSEADRVPTVHGIRMPSFVLPFMIYPEAIAHQELGHYYYRKAKTTDGTLSSILPLLRRSVQEFVKAAETFPRDEEMRPDVLWQQLVAMYRSGHPLRDTLPVCDELAQAVKDKQKIWRGSPNADGGRTDQRYQAFVWFAEDTRKAIAEGQLTLDSQVMPDAMDTTIE